MTAAVPFAIEATGLVKTFGATRAVDGLDLAVPRGGVFGLLGPNGAGKTTTIRIFATLTRADAGQARVLGHDVREHPHAVRASLSLTGQFATIDASLTGMENLLLQARLLGLSRRAARTRAAELLEAFGLSFAVQVPLSFASNVFVSPATMPGWLRAFVNVNPVSHLVTAERALMSGTAAASQVGWVLLASAGLVAVFGPLTMVLYRGRR